MRPDAASPARKRTGPSGRVAQPTKACPSQLKSQVDRTVASPPVAATGAISPAPPEGLDGLTAGLRYCDELGTIFYRFKTGERRDYTPFLAQFISIPEEWRADAALCAKRKIDPARVMNVRGECPGVILTKERGAGGFGYDPLFWYPDFGETFGEAAPEKKNSVSHRGRAMAEFTRRLSVLLGD